MTRQNLYDVLWRRLNERRRFMQVLAGPRQVGKTTLARQVLKAVRPKRQLLVGGQGVQIEEFLLHAEQTSYSAFGLNSARSLGHCLGIQEGRPNSNL